MFEYSCVYKNSKGLQFMEMQFSAQNRTNLAQCAAQLRKI